MKKKAIQCSRKSYLSLSCSFVIYSISWGILIQNIMKLLKNLKSRQGVYPIFPKKLRCVKRARNLLLMTLFMTVLRNYNGRLPSFLSTEIKGSFSYDVLKLRDFFTNGILNEYCTKIVLSANKKPSCST